MRLFTAIPTNKKLTANDRKKIFTLLGFKNQTEYVKASKLSKQEAVARAVTQYNQDIKPLNDDIKKERTQKRKLQQYGSRLKNDINNKATFRKNIRTDTQFENMLDIVLKSNKRFLITWGDTNYTLSEKKIIDLRQHRQSHGSFFTNPTEAMESDAQLFYHLKKGMITFRDTGRLLSSTYSNQKGGFFNMVNISPFDLTDYQIFDSVKKENYENQDCCFLHALKISGKVSDIKMNELRATVKCKVLPKYLLKQLCESLDVFVSVQVPDGGTHKKRWYPNTPTKDEKKQKPIIQLGLINSHYFLIQKVPITKYALEHCYDETFTALENWQMKLYVESKKDFCRDASRNMNSFDVIDYMFKHSDKYFEKMSLTAEIYDTIYYNQFNEITTLEYDEETSVRLNQVKEVKEPKPNNGKQKNKPWHHEFFDFETTTDGTKHRPYLVCTMGVDGKFNTFTSTSDDPKKYDEGVGLSMLNHLVEKYHGQNVRLYAHNGGYDITFIREHLTITKIIERGHSLLRLYGMFYYGDGKYINIEVQCTMAFLACSLSKFKKMFKLTCKKEVIAHSSYNQRSMSNEKVMKRGMLLSACKKYYKKDGKSWADFMSNAREWGCLRDGGRVDIVEYSRQYCIIDCELLRAGWLTFEKWINIVTKLNVNDFISISSLTDNFYRNEGVYEGVYEMSHHVREFSQRSMVGGRCMMNSNKKQHTTFAMDDYDATSLYPSSQYRMKGYLKGKPKVLKDLRYEALETYDGYFVEIVITGVGRHLEFPLMSYVTESKTRHFTNDMIGKTAVVDKFMLEDLIKFQKVTFDIVRGYYYDEGRNEKLSEVVLYLFNERVKAKAEEPPNPIEVVFKLMLNASYGKTLMKPFETETHIMTYKNAEAYIVRNYNKIKSIDILGDATWDTLQKTDKLKIKCDNEISEHFNNAHCGCEVLSMSKRIMNEVMCLAEENNLKIYYQDTDSMHIPCQAVPILEGLFKAEYGRELRGKKLGQFHGDFDSHTLEGKNIHAVESVFLGKKVYIDKLTDGETKDQNGNMVYDYHFRMKGVNQVGIEHRRDVDFDGDAMALYRHMFTGEAVGFDMCGGGIKPTFDYGRNGDISSKREFIRKVQF